MHGKNTALHDVLFGEDRVRVLGRFFHSLHLDQALFNLPRALVLVFDSELQLFNFFLQLGVLLIELLDEFSYVDSLVVAPIHALEQRRNHFIEASTQVCLFFLRHRCGTSNSISRLFVSSEIYEIFDKFFFINKSIVISINVFKLAM